jgi:hypothetical protein
MSSIVKPGCEVALLTKSMEAKQSRDAFETVKPAEEVRQGSSAWMGGAESSRSRFHVGGPPAAVWSSDEYRQ